MSNEGVPKSYRSNQGIKKQKQIKIKLTFGYLMKFLREVDRAENFSALHPVLQHPSE